MKSIYIYWQVWKLIKFDFCASISTYYSSRMSSYFIGIQNFKILTLNSLTVFKQPAFAIMPSAKLRVPRVKHIVETIVYWSNYNCEFLPYSIMSLIMCFIWITHTRIDIIFLDYIAILQKNMTTSRCVVCFLIWNVHLCVQNCEGDKELCCLSLTLKRDFFFFTTSFPFIRHVYGILVWLRTFRLAPHDSSSYRRSGSASVDGSYTIMK